MAYSKTVIRRDPWEVEPFLQKMRLTVAGLRRVRDVALSERGNATAFHPVNSPGTFAYHHGVWALRDQFVGEHWRAERPGGVEAIVAADLTARVAFANVDRCCDENHNPLPISEKGAGVERLCGANLFSDGLPTYTKVQASFGIPLYYCMVDPDGRIELSLPTIEGRSFGPCIERNFISNGDDGDGSKVVRPLDADDAVELTPMVIRKVA